MTTAREEVLCPYPDCNHSYTRRGKLPNVGEGKTYPDISDCPHLLAHPDENPEWNEDLVAAFLKYMSSRLRDLGVDVERIEEGELKEVRPQCEEIIQKYVKEVDCFFFRKNIADMEKAADELRPILIGLQTADS